MPFISLNGIEKWYVYLLYLIISSSIKASRMVITISFLLIINECIVRIDENISITISAWTIPSIKSPVNNTGITINIKAIISPFRNVLIGGI